MTTKHRVRIEFPDGDGRHDGNYELDVVPQTGEYVKGLNNRYYRVTAVVHCVNDQDALPDYELKIVRENLPSHGG